MGYIDKTGNYYEGDMAAGDRVASPAEQSAHDAEIAALMAQQAAYMTDVATAKADAVVQYLRDHTPAECEAYVQTNVTDLASARALMKKFAVALCVLAKQSLR